MVQHTHNYIYTAYIKRDSKKYTKKKQKTTEDDLKKKKKKKKHKANKYILWLTSIRLSRIIGFPSCNQLTSLTGCPDTIH